MKNIITFLLYCLSVTALVAQAQNNTRVEVLTRSLTETTLRLSVEDLNKTAVSTPAGDALVISMEDGTPVLRSGAPDLPKFATALAIPETGNMQVEVIPGDFIDYPDVLVAPSKGNLLRNVDPASVPYEYGAPYEENHFFPGKLYELKTPFILRQMRGQALWLYPVQYNPVSKVLRLYTSMTVRVTHTGGNGENELQRNPNLGKSRTFEQLYQKTFINYDDRYLQRGGGNEPEKMLIIAKDELIPTLEPLVVWKRQMGIHTTVVPTSELGGSDPATLYNFVKQFYNNKGLTYLLLVGDETAIPPQMRPSGGADYSCDNCFGYMDGDDHFNEILVGRFNAETPEQLQIMVNRNIEYEKSPIVDPDQNWCATGMASTSDEGEGIGDDNQADYEQGNEWKTKHLADGYEKYWEFYDGDHSDISPTPGDASADQAGNPTNTQLVDLMNSRGVSIYNYTGHGWEQGLVSGNFNTDAVSLLRNNHRYPILIAVACCAGNFTNNNSGDCLGEAWQRAGNPDTGEPWGGIAGFFSSDFQSWAPPMEGQDGMNQFLTDADGVNLKPSIGSMHVYGNALMIAAYAAGGETMADFWNPFGEPSTVPRTRLPQTLTANHPAGLFIGATSLSVNCTVEGAQIGLYWQNQALAVAYVQNGVAALEFPPLEFAGDLIVTVTQFNYLPYQSAIAVTPSSGAYLVHQNLLLDDSDGNNNQQADYAETLALHLTLSNVGFATAKSSSATLSTDDDNVVILDAEENFGDIDNGSFVEKNKAFSFSVNDDVVDGHVVNFSLKILFNDSLGQTITYPVVLQAPNLAIAGILIDDSQDGNGNKRLESGEKALVRITNLNKGNSQTLPGLAVLNSDQPYLNISAAAPVGPMNAVNGALDVEFSVEVAPNAPKVIPFNFQYELSAGKFNAAKDFGPFILNAIVEDFETKDFGAFPWQMAGSKPWSIVQTGAYAGQTCSRSGTITHNQKTRMSLPIKVTQDGFVSFARRVSSEKDYDFLRFYIDGIPVAEWSGSLAWEEVSFPVAAGYHTMMWSYEKDGVGTFGSDRAWVDEIFLPPYETVVDAPSPGDELFDLKASPNPNDGTGILSFHLKESQRISIQVFDFLGRLVRVVQPMTALPAGPQARTLDLSQQAAGVYLVQVRSETATQTIKVVKQ